MLYGSENQLFYGIKIESRSNIFTTHVSQSVKDHYQLNKKSCELGSFLSVFSLWIFNAPLSFPRP